MKNVFKADSLWCFEAFLRSGSWYDPAYSRSNENAHTAKKYNIVNVHSILQIFFPPNKQFCLVSWKEHLHSWSEIGLAAPPAASLCQLSEHLCLPWRSLSSPGLPRPGSLSSFRRLFQCLFFSQISPVYSKLVLPRPLCPHPSLWVSILWINTEGNEQSDLRISGREPLV